MTNEPERPIEKLLREAARKRADDVGAPLDLHPATRRVLQGEVTRKFAKEPPKGSAWMESLSLLWPRLAWAAAILVVMGLVVWVMVPRPQVADREVAMAQRGSKEEPSVNAAAAPSPEPVTAPAATPPPSAIPAGKLDTPTIVNGNMTAGERDKDSSQYKNTPLSVMPAPAVAKPEVVATEKKTSETESDGIKREESEKMKAPAADRYAAKESPPPVDSSNHSFYARDSSAAEASRPVTPAPAAAPAPAPTTATASPPPAGFGGAMPGAMADGSRKQAEVNALAFNNRQSDARAGSTLSGAAVASDELNTVSPPSASTRSAAPAQRATHSDHMVDGLSLSEDVIAKAEALSKNGAPQIVLNSFRVEQHGSELRLIDADGSIYTGYLQPSTRAYRRRAASAQASGTTLQDAGGTEGARAPVAPAVPSEGQAYTFRVTGTNLTLHKKVVFQGSLTTVTNLALSGNASNTLGGYKAFGSVPVQPSTPINSSISGKLTVGGKEIDVNAAPSAP